MRLDIRPDQPVGMTRRRGGARALILVLGLVISVLPMGPAYAASGLVTTDFAEAVALQQDGKIITVGGTAKIFALARYNANGTLDQTFGTGGRVTTRCQAAPGRHLRRTPSRSSRMGGLS